MLQLELAAQSGGEGGGGRGKEEAFSCFDVLSLRSAPLKTARQSCTMTRIKKVCWGKTIRIIFPPLKSPKDWLTLWFERSGESYAKSTIRKREMWAFLLFEDVLFRHFSPISSFSDKNRYLRDFPLKKICLGSGEIWKFSFLINYLLLPWTRSLA